MEQITELQEAKKLRPTDEALKSVEEAALREGTKNGVDIVTLDLQNYTLIKWGARKQDNQKKIILLRMEHTKYIQKMLTDFESYFPPSPLPNMHGIYANSITDFF